ncbi:MAG: hypothetical protein FRX49_13380 [Trebouxia sp. A1-2]|nr:MAG: hypothetical protein FRX49_13380 [Trebouxia sp. A1-2]
MPSRVVFDETPCKQLDCNVVVQGCEKQPTQPDGQITASKGQNDAEKKTIKLPSFALAHAAVDVSLSTSASSAVSASASQHDQQPASSPQSQHKPEQDPNKRVQAVQQLPAETSAAQPTVQHAPIVHLLSQLDTVKWDQVAAWAAGDSAQAAALIDQLGPSLAESVVSEPDRDHALLRLEAQVACKKLSLSSQQLEEARRENTALHTQLVEMQASQQSLQVTQHRSVCETTMHSVYRVNTVAHKCRVNPLEPNIDGQQLSQLTLQEAALSKQQSAQSDVETKLRSTLQHSQNHAAQLESQLAAATEAALRSQTAHPAQLQQLSDQHATVLSQLRADHDAQLEAATQHHKALLQAHTERLEQQNQAHVQQLLAQHASELHSRSAALTAQLQQQLHTGVEKAASKHAADVTQRQQLLDKSEALLAAEKQKTTALKVGRSVVRAQCNKAQIMGLKALKHIICKFDQTPEFPGATQEGGQGRCSSAHRIARAAPGLQKQHMHSSKAWEEERRKANRSLREAKAAADSDLLKLKQSLADAEQQRHEAVRQCEAEGHRSAVKLAQAGRSLKAARQEAAEAQKQAKEAREKSGHAQARLDQTCGEVRGLHEELQALKTRLASQAALQQDAATSSLRSLEEHLDTQAQHSALLQSVLRTISNVMPATSAQQDRWQQEEEALQQTDHDLTQPQEVLQQVQSYMQQVQAGHDRWQQEEEEHRQQLGSLRVAQEHLEGRLRQQEEAKAVAEEEIARQKGRLGQQLVNAVSVRNELSDANGTLTKQLEQITARAFMAESAAQSLGTQLKTQQDESCKSTQLLQAMFARLAESSSSGGSISPACPQGAEPCSLNRQMTAGLSDQAKAHLVISHVQAVISSSAAQQQRLCMLTQQLERYSAESATATATLQAAAQALPHLKPQPADSSLALSHAVLLENPHSRRAEPDELPQLIGLADVAETVASALTGKQQDLLEVEMQAAQLTQHLRQAEVQVADSESQAQARGVEVQGLQQQLAQAQAELQQIHQLHQQQSTDILELTARNSGLSTELDMQQQQHAKALSRCTVEATAPLERQLASSKQQLKHATQRLHTAEQQLSSHKLSVAEAESRALRAEGLMRKSEERRSGLECDKRRLQAFVRELKSETRHSCADQQLQHLQSVADSVLAELERTRQAISTSTVSMSGRPLNRAPAVARQLLSQALLVDNDENAQPNSIQQLPDSQDAKSERIRQLHLTLGALIDERDELQDTLSSSASPELARQLEDAQAELRVLRKYTGSHTSGRTSLADSDMLAFRQN